MSKDDQLPQGYQQWNPSTALSNLQMEKALDGLSDNPVKLAKRLFDENLPLSVMAICHLAIHSINEGIRFNAARYVVDRSMGAIDKQNTPDGEHVWKSVYDSVLTEANAYLENE
jgi:hypothetical protein